MKRLIAFSSVAHMGFVMLGIATLTTFGINAAIFGMVAHGLITGMLFFIAGSVKERYHTLEIKRLGGLLMQAPRMGWILGFCAMASLGLPGLAGFWGEFPAILSAYNPAAGLSDGAVPRLHGGRRHRHRARRRLPALALPAHRLRRRRRRSSRDDHIHDVASARVASAWTPMLVGIVVLGFVPEPHLPRSPTRRVHVHATPRRRSGRLIRARLARRRRRGLSPPSTTTRSRPRSCSPARSSCCSSSTCSSPSAASGPRPPIAGLGLLGRARARCSPWPSTAPTASMFGGAYVVDNFALVLKALFLAVGLRRRAAVDQLHRRGRLLRGRVLLPAPVARSSAWS